jgi:hypothetical protein
MTKVAVVAEMALRELMRRRSVLVMLLLLPLAFYLSRRSSHTGQSIRFLCLGLGWAFSAAALFAGGAARAIEPRLRLSGFGSGHLVLGRLCALWTLGAVLSVPYWILIRFDQDNVRYGAVALIMALTVAVSAPFGLALSAVLPRELEGTLLLLVIIGLQMMMDPAGSATRALPFWFSREIGTYAVDHTDGSYLERGLVHGMAFAAALIAVVLTVSAIRLRRRGHMTNLAEA